MSVRTAAASALFATAPPSASPTIGHPSFAPSQNPRPATAAAANATHHSQRQCAGAVRCVAEFTQDHCENVQQTGSVEQQARHLWRFKLCIFSVRDILTCITSMSTNFKY